jgi:hypothetical protein
VVNTTFSDFRIWSGAPELLKGITGEKPTFILKRSKFHQKKVHVRCVWGFTYFARIGLWVDIGRATKQEGFRVKISSFVPVTFVALFRVISCK